MSDVDRSGIGRTRAARWSRRAVGVLAWFGLSIAVAGLLVRAVALSWQPAIVAAAFSPYLVLCALPAGVLLAVRRSWLGTAAALVLLSVWFVAAQLPLLVSDPSAGGTGLTVLQANLRLGSADAASLVDQVASGRVDVMTVDELTGAEVTRLTAAGIDRQLPYRYLAAYPGGAGTGIWSRYPISSRTRDDSFTFQLLAGRIEVPGAGPVQVIAVHLLPPWPYPSSTWAGEIGRLRGLLASARAGADSVIVSGDFNATLDTAQLRRLTRHGYRDGAEQSGAGFGATYPSDRFFLPVLTLDHVLLAGARARSVQPIHLVGSDHRGLLVRLTLPAQ